MKFLGSLLTVAGAVSATSVPSMTAPACSAGKGSVSYDKTVPDKASFPKTQVDVCYDDTSIHITFTAFEETNYYFNSSQTTNDPIWQYEVMEGFVYRGTNDPQTYLEFEVSPNNVTFQAWIFNKSKVRAASAPLDTSYLTQPLVDGLTAETTLDKEAQTWVSSATIPLGLFNVDDGQAAGTEWRMNFFRTVVSPDTFPDQLLGAWNPTNESNFHMTPFFGRVSFV
ncbi:uncharacterized protein GGS22DRAFT_188768 [Annulohypoxylon maeteangense]|uniref:uncharacterized protein n=1 Tax=Annulohypoxylon maeteangense TaxID=1927788 RepID=UPI0020082921|nr:uncharacterized protein GGS22DRAFT_188768 [Annulohypoxylon maeteangense]KAI0884559.1 hypothetical protein GGS22DRAFT_188768 [Annulohypoxylon maeteangense]